jgi:hypothetical protein
MDTCYEINLKNNINYILDLLLGHLKTRILVTRIAINTDNTSIHATYSDKYVRYVPSGRKGKGWVGELGEGEGVGGGGEWVREPFPLYTWIQAMCSIPMGVGGGE